MKISFARLFLPLILALAFVVRYEPTRTLRLAADEQRDLGGAKWLIDDPATCHELRRIELAIAGARVPSHDRFVNHPDGGEIPALSFFDGCIAGIAQRVLRSPSGEVALGYVDERELEDFVIGLAPILGLLAVLATYWAARTIVERERSDVAVLVATACVAFHPASIAATSAGVLDSAALTTIVCALLVRSVVRSIRATSMSTSLLDALVAGALAGILLASTVAGFVVFLAAWIALFVHVLRSSGEARANALRAGVFFTVITAFIARLSFTEGQLDERAFVGGFSAGISLLAFFAAVPYLMILLFDRDKKPSMFRVACFVVALGLLVTQVVTVGKSLAHPVLWFTTNHAEIARVAPEFTAQALDGGTTALWIASLATAVWAWRKRADTVTLGLGIFTTTLAVASLATALAVPLWVVAVACALARAIDQEVSSRRIAIAAGAACAVSLALALKSNLVGPDAQARQERLDFVAGLRWLRTNSESGGPWNSPGTPNSWGVLSNTADGPLVLYHARRPALASPWGMLSGPEPLRETAQRFHGDDLAVLERWMHGQGAQYVVTAGRASRRNRDMSARTESVQSNGVADRLLDAATEPARPIGGFSLEFVSKRRVDADGKTVLDGALGRPVIAIWRLAREDPTTPRAEMRSR